MLDLMLQSILYLLAIWGGGGGGVFLFWGKPNNVG
jgi:hypothetical protein